MSPASVDDGALFRLRRERGEPDLLPPLRRLYGTHPGFEDMLLDLDTLLARAWDDRPDRLRRTDLARDLNPDWFLEPDQLGYVFYVDRFAGTLTGVLDHIDYLRELGVTYVHFMPCLKPREGPNDGGYSVQDYRRIDPRLGSMDDFREVADRLAEAGIGVCLDMVLNHTAAEHAWAEAAKAGDPAYRDYYLTFPDDILPRQYEQTMPEIFPEDAPGSFTYDDAMGRWVWTTFHHHQWDLNWSNPRVFLEILDVMLFLLNQGATTLRLDAVAFMWKQMGTTCQNLPPVHDILQALRAATRIVAAGSLLKSEAIVAPSDLVHYLGTGSHTGRVANLAYHNNLMVQFWSSLAARDTRLMTHILRTHFPDRFPNATWGTYLRCHDDIGWAITPEDAQAVDWDGPAHRRFLSDFYTGEFDGSFARGTLFQVNEDTGDRRNNGTTASLAGLEAAFETGDPYQAQDAIRRIHLGHALIASFGGIPLIYMGDEIGLMNDYGDHADTRALHRPAMDWDKAARRTDPATMEGLIFDGIRHILARRAATPALHGKHPTRILETHNPRLFAVLRDAPGAPLVCVFNFSETPQSLPVDFLLAQGVTEWTDRLAGQALDPAHGTIPLPPYGALWIA